MTPRQASGLFLGSIGLVLWSAFALSLLLVRFVVLLPFVLAKRVGER